MGAVLPVLTPGNDVRRVNSVISDHSDVNLGRQGIPLRARTANIISLVVEGDTDRIGSVRGKLGRLPGIRVKSLLFSQMLKNIKSLLKYFSDTTKMVIFGSTIGK